VFTKVVLQEAKQDRDVLNITKHQLQGETRALQALIDTLPTRGSQRERSDQQQVVQLTKKKTESASALNVFVFTSTPKTKAATETLLADTLTAAANTHIRTTLSLTPSTQDAQAADINTINT
jgi:hypothetical protein